MSAALSLPRTILELPHGLHRDVANATYHEPVLGLASKSGLDRVHRSPAHYRAELATPREPSPALIVGTALHTRLFEPDRFSLEYTVAPEFGDLRKTDDTTKEDAKANKDRRDAWRTANAGKLLLSAEDDATTRGMVDALNAHPLASKLFADGEREVTLRWKDAETGIECKSRADYYVPVRRLVVDLKSTEDAREQPFRRSVEKWGYHRQDAMYRDAFAACQVPVDHFVFVAVEKTFPFAIGVYVLDATSVAKGRATIHADLRTLAECIANDSWPAYPTGIQTLSVSDWSE